MKQSPDRPRGGKGDIPLLAVSRIARSIAAGMINVAFPYYILSTLHYGALVLGLIYVSATVATAVVGFLAGIAADVWGRRGTLIAASVLLPVSAVLVYASRSLWLIVPAAMLGGYSATGSLAGGGVGGAVQPIQGVVLAGLTSRAQRTRYFSVFTFLSGATAALGALAARFLEVRTLFLAAAIVSAMGIPGLWKVRAGSANGSIGRLKTKATIGKFTLTGVLNGFSQGLVIPFLIPFFVLVYHVPKSQMSVFAAASGLLGSLAMLAAPLLESRLGFVKSILVTRGIGMLLFAIFPIVRFLPLAVAIYVLSPALRVAAMPIQQSELTKQVDDDEMGRALGINQVARLAATSAGTGLAGHLLDTSLFELPFFLYGLIMAGNLLLYLRFFGTPGARRKG